MPDHLLFNHLSPKAETGFYALVKISILPIVPEPSSNQMLKQHQATHTGERSLVCLFCVNKHTQDGKLTRHKRIHNGDRNQRWKWKRERPYNCKLTEFFSPNPRLENSYENHVEKTSFWCLYLYL